MVVRASVVIDKSLPDLAALAGSEYWVQLSQRTLNFV